MSLRVKRVWLGVVMCALFAGFSQAAWAATTAPSGTTDQDAVASQPAASPETTGFEYWDPSAMTMVDQVLGSTDLQP